MRPASCRIQTWGTLCLTALLLSYCCAARSSVRGSLSPHQVLNMAEAAATLGSAVGNADGGADGAGVKQEPGKAPLPAPLPASGAPAPAPATGGAEPHSEGSHDYKLKPGTDLKPISTAMAKIRRVKTKLDRLMEEQPKVRNDLEQVVLKEHEITGKSESISKANDEMKTTTADFQTKLTDLLNEANRLMNGAKKAEQEDTAENRHVVEATLSKYEGARNAATESREHAITAEKAFNDQMSEFRAEQQKVEGEYADLEKRRYRMRVETFDALRQLFYSDKELAAWAKDADQVTQQEYDEYVKVLDTSTPKWEQSAEDPKYFLVLQKPIRIPEYKCFVDGKAQTHSFGTKWATGELQKESRPLTEVSIDDAIAYQYDEDHIECFSVIELHNDWKTEPKKWGIKPGSTSNEAFNDVFMSQFEMQEKHLGLEKTRPNPDPRPCAQSAEEQEKTLFGLQGEVHEATTEEKEECMKRHPTASASEIAKLLMSGECASEAEDEKQAEENEINMTDNQKKFAMECGLLDTKGGPEITARLIKEGAKIEDCKNKEKVDEIREEVEEKKASNRRGRGGKINSQATASSGATKANTEGAERLAGEGGDNKSSATLKSGVDGEVLAPSDGGTISPGPSEPSPDHDGTCEFVAIDVAGNAGALGACNSGREHSVLEGWNALELANPDIRVLGCKKGPTLNCYDVLELKSCFGSKGSPMGTEDRKDPFIDGNIFPTEFMDKYRENFNVFANDVDDDCSKYVFDEFEMGELLKQGKTAHDALDDLLKDVDKRIIKALPRAVKSAIHTSKEIAEKLAENLSGVEDKFVDVDGDGDVDVDDIMQQIAMDAGSYQVVATPGQCQEEGAVLASAGELQYTLMESINHPQGTKNPFLGWSTSDDGADVQCFQVMKLVRYWLKEREKGRKFMFGINPEAASTCTAETEVYTPTCQIFNPPFLNLVRTKFDAYVNRFVEVCKNNQIPHQGSLKKAKFDDAHVNAQCYHYGL